MNLTVTAQATLLLTSYFSAAKNEECKPLSNTEWGRFALWLRYQQLAPADLLAAGAETHLAHWNDSDIPVSRIMTLLGRSHSLALAVEKWQRAGLWIVTRADADYPVRLKNQLKNDSPPVLFGCGNRALLSKGGVAIVGSRNAINDDLHFTETLAQKLAEERMNVVSGGARGVDEHAMLAALAAGGTATGILADSLIKAATSAKWRQGLMSSNLVLISPFYPEAGFSVVNAMSRNKYIYCLADSSLVVHAGMKGGTLSGALEALKHQWVPLWVKPTDDQQSSNVQLVQKGGRWCAQDAHDILPATLRASRNHTPAQTQPMLFSLQEPSAPYSPSGVDFYSLFLRELNRLAQTPVTLEVLLSETKLHKEQIAVWLEKAMIEGSVECLSDPVRYQLRQ